MVKDPSKQRKLIFSGPLHHKGKCLSAHLSKELRKQYKRRSMRVKKNDVVIVKRGEFTGIKGKVVRVMAADYKIYLDTTKRKKVNGQEVSCPVHPSNLEIVELDLADNERKKILERKG